MAVPLFWYGRYYFVGDTQSGAFPQWYYYGKQLLSGHWPVLNLWGWRGGNNVAEGQLGLFSPVQILLSVSASMARDAVVFSTIAKTLAAVVAALGGYALARSYDLKPAFAYVVGSTIVLGGEMQYLDMPSWVTGVLVWAILPWAWWGVRRLMIQRANPLLAFVACVLIVTIGYVFGTIYLAIVFVGCLLDAARIYGRGAFVRVLSLGVLAGLSAVVVYLPGILTSPVTLRSNQGITNDNQLAVQVSHYAASMIPTGLIPATVDSMGTKPLGYIAWFLPILLWVDVRRVRAAMRPMAGALLVLVATVLWTLGPSVVGPLRFPVRVMPVVVLVAILLTITLLAKATSRPSRARLWLSLSMVGLGVWVTASRSVPDAIDQFGCGLLVCAGLAATWLLWRRFAAGDPVRAGGLVCALLVAWSVGLQVYQHAVFARPPSLDRHTASASDAFGGILADARGDVMALGTTEPYLAAHPTPSKEIVVAGSWYLTDHRVANTYTTIGFRKYVSVYCFDHLGQTCPRSLKAVLSPEPATGKTRADLLSVSTLVLWRPTLGAAADAAPPAGWHVARTTPHTVMWVRDTPVPTAGGVVDSSSGTTVTQLTQTPRDASFRVDGVPAGGGRVTFSRLAWPGYSVHGGTLADPVDGYLLTVKVPAGSQGRTIAIHYTPPGWALGISCFFGSIALALLWSVVAFVRGRRSGAAVGNASDPSTEPTGTPGTGEQAQSALAGPSSS